MSQVQGNKMKIQSITIINLTTFNKICCFQGNRCRSQTGAADYTWTVYDRRRTAGTPADVMDRTRSEDYNNKKISILLSKSFILKNRNWFPAFCVHHKEISAAVVSSACRLRVHFQPWMLPTRPGKLRPGGRVSWTGWLHIWITCTLSPWKHLHVFEQQQQ